LKKADIGVAMGQTGTDVAKDAAEIILLDDSFATLVDAIKEGRTIFQNLKKTVLSSMTSNGGELVAVLLGIIGNTLFGWPLAISAVQILAIDLLLEMLPLASLSWDPPQKNIMQKPARNIHHHILSRNKIIDIIWSGLLM
jgi:Ca2+-transporting ATPase